MKEEEEIRVVYEGRRGEIRVVYVYEGRRRGDKGGI